MALVLYFEADKDIMFFIYYTLYRIIVLLWHWMNLQNTLPFICIWTYFRVLTFLKSSECFDLIYHSERGGGMKNRISRKLSLNT